MLRSVHVDSLISDVNLPGNLNGPDLPTGCAAAGSTSAAGQASGEVEQYASFLAKPYDGEEVRQPSQAGAEELEHGRLRLKRSRRWRDSWRIPEE